MAKPFWATQFKIEDAAWAELSNQASQKMRLPLALAFEQGLLNENHFVAWERERSGLLSLKSVFFNGQPPRDLWMHYDFKVCEQVFAMPVGQWQDQVYWAKLADEPNGMESLLKNATWVLAPYSALKKWFALWQGEVSGVGHSANSNSRIPSFAPSLSAIPKVGANAGSFGGFSPTEEATTVQEKADSSPESSELKLTEIPEDYSGPPQGIGAIDEEKTLINIDFATIRPMLAHEENGEVVTNPSLSVSVRGTQVDFILPPLKEPSPLATPAPVPAPTTAAQSTKLTNSEFSPSEITVVSLETLSDRLKTARTQDEITHVILGGWQNYFDSVMILLVQDGNLVVWKWWGQWLGTFKRGEVISLDTPSVFKITYKTQHPYHGHVTAGPTNDHFFNLVNSGKYPEHITVMPVIAEGGQCLAMLVGTCGKDAGSRMALNRLEDQAKLFAAGLAKFLHPGIKAS